MGEVQAAHQPAARLSDARGGALQLRLQLRLELVVHAPPVRALRDVAAVHLGELRLEVAERVARNLADDDGGIASLQRRGGVGHGGTDRGSA
jgi:hypothetical protein